MDKKELSIAVPASVVSDIPHLRERTSAVGVIGRAAAIFRVGEIIVYPDDPHRDQSNESNLIRLLLAYMDTPQYLRKRLFKLRPELRYAGVLPPLRTSHHPLKRRMKSLSIGEYREGVVLSCRNGGVLVDIGVEKSAFIPSTKLPKGQRITLRVTKLDRNLEARQAARDEISQYWGYTVAVERHPFGEIMRRRGFDLKVATSRYGSELNNVAGSLTAKWEEACSILVAFGAPSQGLYEIVGKEGLNLEDIMDFVINTVPMQGTETIRTEEAIFASLAVLNMKLAFKA
ncbi:S1 RNA-binding domain-containing protein [Candidatus Bathyarchaeota archaeon]|nr:S1 RNA-binding domain-containing protein [Candidatus Bathyarchaeota archaeon]